MLLVIPSEGRCQAPASTATTQSPNIVVIFMDDMGYADIGAFGAEGYETPNLDRMAKEGRRFTDFVVSSAVCSASRSALLTGCYHRRIGISGALGPNSQIGISDDELTLAELCNSRGYATAIFGKWHLGHHPRFLPTNHGFDHYYGIPYSNDMWPLHPQNLARLQKDPNAELIWPRLPIIENTTVVNSDVQPEDQKQFTTEFTRRAVEFIHSNADKPFFLYLPHPMVHVPLYVSDKFEGKSGAGLFADVMMEVDWSVGQILSAIDSIGADERTLVIFTSDNGPWLSYGNHAGSAKPLREGKGTMFEGGYRVPALMRWPTKIPANTTCDTLASTIDILPTVAALIDANLPEHPIDGIDIRELLFSTTPQTIDRTFACYYAGGELQAVRNDRFKLVFPHRYRTMAGRPGGSNGMPNEYSTANAPASLYDLNNDVSESTDVSEQHPEIVRQLQLAAEHYRKTLGDRLSKKPGTEIRPAGKLTKDDLRLQW